MASYTVEASLSWNGIGYGLRIGQMMGAHRKKSYEAVPTVEGELRKRVFWCANFYISSYTQALVVCEWRRVIKYFHSFHLHCTGHWYCKIVRIALSSDVHARSMTKSTHCPLRTPY